MASYGSRYRTLGLLWAVYGVLMIAAAVWILVYEGQLTVMWGAIINRVPNPLLWMSGFHLFLVATVVMALISAALSLLAAMALMRGASSSRSLGLSAAVFGMLGTPPGIALGAFTAVILYPVSPKSETL